jgi:Ca2+-binding RTX toxin-like protein
VLKGTSEGDSLSAAGGSACVLAEAGEDVVTLGSGDATVVAGLGNDEVYAGSGKLMAYLGEGDDVLVGTNGELFVDAGPGNDRINGSLGADVIYPGPGVDTVLADNGNDTIVITSACDVGPGSILDGGEGYDVLQSSIPLNRLKALGAVVKGIEAVEVSSKSQLSPACWQEMFDGGVLFGTERVTLKDRTSVLSLGGLGNVVSGGYLELGVSAVAGSAHALGDVFLANYSSLDGDLRYSGTLTKQQGANVRGDERHETSLPIDAGMYADWQVAFQAGASFMLQDDSAHLLAPGSYGAVHVHGRTKLHLLTGEYYFDSLKLEPDAELTLDDGAGAIVVYVKNELQLRGLVEAMSRDPNQLFFIYLGRGDVTLTRAVRARFLAPEARLVLETPGQEFWGSFVAQQIEVRPGVSVHLVP